MPVGPPSTQERGFWKSQKGLGRGRKDPALCSSIPRDSPSSWLHLCASKVAPGGSGSPGITLDPIQIHPSRIHHPSHTHRLVQPPPKPPVASSHPPNPSSPLSSFLLPVWMLSMHSELLPISLLLQSSAEAPAPFHCTIFKTFIIIIIFSWVFSLSHSSLSPRRRVPEVLLCAGSGTVQQIPVP